MCLPACLFRLCVVFAITLSVSQKSETRGTPTAGKVSQVRHEDDNVAAETTVAPVSRANESFTTSAPHLSFPALQTIQIFNTTTSSVSLQEDAKHSEDMSKTGAGEDPNPTLTRRGKKTWELSTSAQSIKHNALSAQIPASTSPSDMVAEQDQSLFQSNSIAGSIMEAIRSIGATSSYEQFVTSCSGTGERLCGCSASCTAVENCCYDSEYVQAAIESTAQNSQRYSCYSDINKKWTLSSPSRLINRCSFNWTDDIVRGLCENPDENDLRSYVPCYSPGTRLSYKNLYCLHCNGLSESSLWEVTFQSSHPYSFSLANSFAKMNNRAGRPFLRSKQFFLSPRAGFEPSQCSLAVVDQCNPNFAAETISKMCRAYYNPVLIQGITYRNAHCFQCATEMSIEDVRPAKIARQRQNPMSLLLNMRFDQKRMACPETGCVPEVTRVRGYYRMFSVGVTFTTVANISSLDRRAIIDLNSRLVFPPVSMFIKEKLKQYKHEVEFYMPKAYSLEDKKEILITLLINDDIPVGNIPVINQRVLSINFESNVNNTIHVSCCQNAHVVNVKTKAISGFDEMKTDSSCPEMTCNDNNTAVGEVTASFGVNSAQKQCHVPLVVLIDLTWVCLITALYSTMKESLECM